jgi:peptidoglycan/xylan/chitin deacetylase (PgdA/CDA1 family)
VFVWVTLAVHVALTAIALGNPWVTGGVLGVYVVYHVVVAWGVLHPQSGVFGPNCRRMATSEPVVALTFDDGPHPEVTPRVLDILREHDARATFFLIGKWAERHPDIVRRIVAEGHQIGNHSWSHSYLFWAWSPRLLREDLERGQRVLRSLSGTPCRWFRAPVGMKAPWLSDVLERLGLRLVSWEVRFFTRGAADPARLARTLRRRLAPGSVLMLHDGHDRKPVGNPAVLDALPRLLESLSSLGYRCVSLP